MFFLNDFLIPKIQKNIICYKILGFKGINGSLKKQVYRENVLIF